MSTVPQVPQAPVLPFLLTLNNYFAAYAQTAAQLAIKEQADIAAHQHVQAVNDAVLAVASTLGQQLPWEQNNIAAAASLFVAGESLITSLVSIFRHPKATAPAAAPAASGSTV